jgi:hypothetical protein
MVTFLIPEPARLRPQDGRKYRLTLNGRRYASYPVIN